MKLRALLGAAVVAVLSGCAGAPQVVQTYQMYLPQFPNLLVTPTNVTAPPDPATYIGASAEERDQLLTEAFIQQTSNVNTCNIDKGQIASWYTQQQAVVAAANAASGTAVASPAASGAQAKQ